MAEKTIEELQLELETAIADNAKLIDALATSNKEAADNLELASVVEAKRAELEEEIASLGKQLAASQNDTRIQVDARNKDLEIIRGLQTELEGLKKLSDEGKPLNEFERNGEKYRLNVAKVRIPGINENQPLTALEVLNSTEAQDELIRRESGAITKLA